MIDIDTEHPNQQHWDVVSIFVISLVVKNS